MILHDFLFAFVVALLCTLLFSIAFRKSVVWEYCIVFFVVILLASWAGGVWIAPPGPFLYKMYWFPFLLVGSLTALLVAAHTPHHKSMKNKGAIPGDSARRPVKPFNVLMWIFLIFLVLTLVLGYIRLKPVY